MVKININYEKSFLPQSVIRGTQTERFAKAREMNEKLQGKLSKVFEQGKTGITIPRFKQELSRVTGKNDKQMPINVFIDYNDARVQPSQFGRTPYLEGYTFYLPGDIINQTLTKGYFNILLRKTQNFFDGLFNPKFLKRSVQLDKRVRTRHAENQFIQDILLNKKEMTKKDLNKILRGRTPATKINILQLFRYKLLGKINENQFMQDMRKKSNSTGADFSAYHLDEKLKLISENLRETIAQERAKIQAKNATTALNN